MSENIRQALLKTKALNVVVYQTIIAFRQGTDLELLGREIFSLNVGKVTKELVSWRKV